MLCLVANKMFNLNLNIRLLIKPLVLILGVLSILFSAEPIPRSDCFLLCLNSNIDPLKIYRTDSGAYVDNTELNKFFVDNEIVSLEEWIPGATEMDKDGDIYLNRIYRVYIPENRQDNTLEIINDVQKLSSVKYSEIEYVRKPLYSPNDPLSGGQQCSLNSVKAREAWDFWDIPNGVVPDGSNVLLASVDTGVDYTHPDLQNNSWINQGEVPEWMFEAGIDLNSDGIADAFEVVSFLVDMGQDINSDGEINLRDAVSDGSPFEDLIDNDGNSYVDDLIGWDSSGFYGPDDNDPFPKEGVTNNGTWAHGTHVAGILAATTDNELGMASTSYNAKFISVKVSRENQNGDPGISDGYAGITYAAKAGYYSNTIAIINNSWGGGGYTASENSVINNAQNTYGAIILGAAGNGDEGAGGGQEYSSHYPSSYDNCISVCAIGCNYSWGNWATYHPTVDLAAPGESVQSAIIGSSFESWDGSSMACPNAASAIGLLYAYHSDWTNLQLRQRIEDSADRRIYELNPDYETCNGNSGVDCLGKGMVDVYKAIGMDFSPSISIDSFDLILNNDSNPSSNADSDNILNPGESGVLNINLANEIGWSDASALIATLTTSNEFVSIDDDTHVYGNMQNNTVSSGDFSFFVSELIPLGTIDFVLNVSASGLSGYQYSKDLNLSVNVSLFQEGFPYDVNSEVRSAPVVVDLDNDGDNEIVFADYGGFVHVIKDGEELNNDTFPYEVGDQIWGAISSADVDLDGYQDFVVSSKSGQLLVFDIFGLKVDYDSGRWLIATPVIGNIDQDEQLEIVVGAYQSPTSSCPLIAINHDGTDVNGFPYVVGEKIKAGVALADLNNNNIDDIIYGTDSDNLYVLLDDLSVASGFPVDLGSNLQSEPAIMSVDNDFLILIGCKNDNFYGINYSDASLRFVIPTGDDVYTSPSFHQNNIFFGSDDGNVYGIDLQGNFLEGFPKNINGSVVGSVVVSDLDSNGEVDLIASNDSGEMHAFSLVDGNYLDYFPISYQFPFSSSPQIVDYDNDNDLDIICGTTGDLVLIDVKNYSENEDDLWSFYKGSLDRRGYYEGAGSEWDDCSSPGYGDINCDSIINILDIVTTVNIVVGGTDGFTDYQLWAADINSDSIINVLDIVLLVNIVVDQ